jgi:hypothetical protein
MAVLFRDLLHDGLHLRLKPHVQHPIGLVEHEVANPTEINLPRRGMG